MAPSWFASVPIAISLFLFLLVSAVILQWRGWLPLMSPVLSWEVWRMTRRSPRGLFAARSAYVLVLFALVLTSCAQATGSVSFHHLAQLLLQGVPFAPQKLPSLMERLEETFFLVQLVAIVLLAPAFIGGAIAEEEERKSLDFLLISRLSAAEIVLGKLLARLAQLASVLLTGLPVLAALQLLGGIDPQRLLFSLAGCGMTLLSISAVSMLQSVLARRTPEAVFRTYLVLAAYLALSLFLCQYTTFQPGPTWLGMKTIYILDALTLGNPLVAVLRYAHLVEEGMRPAECFQEVLLGYCLFHLLVLLGCLLQSVHLLRRGRHRPADAPVPITRNRTHDHSFGPALFPHPVGDQPLLWKEMYAEDDLGKFGAWRVGRWLLLLSASVLACGGFFATVGGRLLHPTGEGNVNVWVRGVSMVITSVLNIGIAVRAAGSLTRERERRTFDALLSTPLSLATILHSKLVGSMARFKVGWGVLALTWLVGFGGLGLHFLALPLAVAAVIVHAAFAAVLGIFCSQVCRSTWRAALWAVTLLLGFNVGHWVLYYAVEPWEPGTRPSVHWGSRGKGDPSCWLAWPMGPLPPLQQMSWRIHLTALTPPSSLAGLLYCRSEAATAAGREDIVFTSLLALSGLLWYGGVGGSLYLWTYDRLGRESNRQPPLPRKPPTLPI